MLSVLIYSFTNKLTETWLDGSIWLERITLFFNTHFILDPILLDSFTIRFIPLFFITLEMLFIISLFIYRYRITSIIGLSVLQILYHYLFYKLNPLPYMQSFSLTLLPFLVVFLNESDIKHYILKLSTYINENLSTPIVLPEISKRKQKLILTFICIFFSFQILIPLRPFISIKDANWSARGHYFSWRMKLNNRDYSIKTRVFDSKTLKTVHHDITKDIYSVSGSTSYPYTLIAYAHKLRDHYEQNGFNEPVVNIDALVSINKRTPQPLFNKFLNLSELNYNTFKKNDWLNKFDNTPLPKFRY